MPRASVSRKLLLKFCNVRTEDIVAAGQHLFDRGQEFVL